MIVNAKNINDSKIVECNENINRNVESLDAKNFKIISIDSNTKRVKFSYEIKGAYENLKLNLYYSQRGRFVGTITIPNGSYSQYTEVIQEIVISNDFLNQSAGLIPSIKEDVFRIDLFAENFATTLSYNYYPEDSTFLRSSEIDVKNFNIDASRDNRLFFSFDIKGKYHTITYAIYKETVSSSSRLVTINWNSDNDNPIFYPEYFNYKSWHPSPNQVIGGKYILVLDYWYNGIKQTKTLEYNKEIPAPPKRNDVKITNVKIRNVMDSFSKPPIYNSSSPTIPTIQSGQQYVAHITVENVGDLDINRQLTVDLRGYDRTNPNNLLFSFPSNFPSIKKGGQVYEFPIMFNQGVATLTFQDPNALEILIHIDPSNSLNDKNLADNKHIIKYKFKGPFGRSSSNTSNIEVFDASGNKVKSVSVDDTEKGVLEVKKSLPKGHYYFNIDGKKTQVRID